MSPSTQSTQVWTASEVVQRFGPIAISRLRVGRIADRATDADVLEIYEREKRLYELVDGLLLEKPMGSYESMIAAELIAVLGTFVRQQGLGKVLGESGMVRLSPSLVRIPDACFISQQRFEAVNPSERIWSVVPDLVIEVLSDSNTAKEMQQKRTDYFHYGVREIWEVDAHLKAITVFDSGVEATKVLLNESFSHSRVLPGLHFSLKQIFE